MFKPCKRCKKFRTRFFTKLRLECFLSPITLLNSSLAREAYHEYNELCMSCIREIIDKTDEEIRGIYTLRVEKLLSQENNSLHSTNTEGSK